MLNKTNKPIIMLALVLLFLVVIPISFAENNETMLDSDAEADDVGSGESVPLTSTQSNHIYFNASVENDNGDGSKENPYKYLTDNRIKKDSIIHLANGEYSFTQKNSANYKNLTIYGQDSENTIIKGSGGTMVVNTALTVKDLTFFNVTVYNQGKMYAYNTIFSSSTAPLENYEKSFGGAIHATGSSYDTYVYNCTFINNYAKCGGAIYTLGGILEVYDSRFINNTAFFYGGAIAAEPPHETNRQPKVKILRSSFINSTSLNDAGGAVYLKRATLDADYVNVSNSNARFGSAFTLLKTYSNLNHLSCINNTAVYDGGAIYFMYANVTLQNSNFTDNRAENGGALFISSAYYGLVENNIFENNAAGYIAGAFFSFLNDYFMIGENTYIGNSAESFDDLYECLEISLNIGNSNYTMYSVNVSDGNLPSYYNLADLGYVTPVKSQQGTGNCWAFSTLAALESCILKATGVSFDFSENNMKNIMQIYSPYGWSKTETNEGAYMDAGIAYLTSWLGPVLDADDLFSDMSALSPVLNSTLHVQNVLFLTRNDYTDNDAIKQAIYKYGGVATSIYNQRTVNQYYTGSSASNHAVTIVGWDDTYSKSNFNNKPPANGAWIVKNSWGTSWGNNGYYYVSYYDKSIARVGKQNSAYTFILNNTIKYDRNYQYDIPGRTDSMIFSQSTLWFKNIFTADDNEYLAAVSTFFEKATDWTLSVSLNGKQVLTQSGSSEAGYYTIDLDNMIALKKGDAFEVMFKIVQDGDASFGVSEYQSLNNKLYKEGISFVSLDGKNWADLYDYEHHYTTHNYYSGGACIKAFTVFDAIGSSLTLTVDYDGSNPVRITAKVLNEWGNPVHSGSVTFNLNGDSKSAKLTDGFAVIEDIFEEGLNYVSAAFSAVGYKSSSNGTSFSVSKIPGEISLSVSTNLDTANLKVTLPSDFTGDVTVSLDGVNSTGHVVNGSLSVPFSDLNNGQHTVKVYANQYRYSFEEKSKTFTIYAVRTNIQSSNIVTYYRNGVFTAVLVNQNSQPISGKTLTFTLNGRSYSRQTNAKGEASIDLDLENGVYYVSVKFNSDSTYFASSATYKITVKTSINLPASKYTYNSKYSPVILNGNGKPLAKTKVGITLVGSKTYNVYTDANGKASLNLGLKPGTYKMTVTNPKTGETVTQSITVVKRLSENADLTMYFGAGKSYKVRAFDDNGNPAAGVYVKITISGKSYNIKTDKNGYASLKINLKSGTYPVSVEYNGFKVSNKIVVKPTLIAGNLEYKKASSYKYYAKLLDTNGKVLANKLVTFKINGKTYTAKTSAYGYAIIYIKLNLAVGKYSITSTYGKETSKNTITIKK